MPADVTYLAGTTSCSAVDSKLFPLCKQDFYYPEFRDSMSAKPFCRVPTFKQKSLKSCIKSSTGLSNPNLKLDELKQDSCSCVKDTPCGRTKKEKRVTFADSQGGILALTRYMTETSSDPPLIRSSSDVFKALVNDLRLNDASGRHNVSDFKLSVEFEQPAADYVKFKQKVDTNNVALENVVLETSNSIYGTIKVKNIAYHKIVFLRVTFDRWRTKTDISCKYVHNSYDCNAYDTFKFKVDFPASFHRQANKMEFCICYECKEKQFWDNNEGKNYSISNALLNSSSRSHFSIGTHIAQRNNFSFPSTYTSISNGDLG